MLCITETRRNIYCIKNIFDYEILKVMQGNYCYLPNYLSFMEFTEFLQRFAYYITTDETCESIMKQCEEEFGLEYSYIQSGIEAFGTGWATVEAAGEMCPHLFATPLLL